jgi:putative toxin-antitoxin system antitoxin component (TIGR02293 family)
MVTPIAEVARILGLAGQDSRAMSPMHLMGMIEAGLPISALDRLSESVAPADAGFKYRIVSRATLARRRKPGQARLLGGEGDRLVRLAGVWAFAREVWGGDEPARAFFFRAHPLLEGRLPVDVVLSSELGAQLVNDILGRLKYGTAA